MRSFRPWETFLLFFTSYFVELPVFPLSEMGSIDRVDPDPDEGLEPPPDVEPPPVVDVVEEPPPAEPILDSLDFPVPVVPVASDIFAPLVNVTAAKLQTSCQLVYCPARVLPCETSARSLRSKRHPGVFLDASKIFRGSFS